MPFKALYNNKKVDMFKSISSRWRHLVEKHCSKTVVSTLEIGNLLVAISTTGLVAIGVIDMPIILLASSAVVLVLLGIVGRTIDSIKDDKERLEVYANSLKGGVSESAVAGNSCNDNSKPE